MQLAAVIKPAVWTKCVFYAWCNLHFIQEKAAFVDASWKQCSFHPEETITGLYNLGITYFFDLFMTSWRVPKLANMLTLIDTVLYVSYSMLHIYSIYKPHCARAVNHRWWWTGPVWSGIPLYNSCESRRSLWFIGLRYVQGIHVWVGTRSLCIVNGHSLHSCLDGVSMELCCTLDYRVFNMTLRGWELT